MCRNSQRILVEAAYSGVFRREEYPTQACLCQNSQRRSSHVATLSNFKSFGINKTLRYIAPSFKMCGENEAVTAFSEILYGLDKGKDFVYSTLTFFPYGGGLSTH